jgi:hypothetical protein
MYIHCMKTTARLLAALTVATLLSPLVPTLLCASPGTPAMACCRTAAPCDLQMQSGRCCAVQRGTAAPQAGPAGVETSSQVRVSTQKTQAALAGPGHTVDAPVLAPRPVQRLWYPPAHDRSPSLYLRNASILR